MTGARTKTQAGPVERPFRFDLTLAQGAGVSQRTQLTRALVDEIRRGRLAPGAKLPGSRTLAARLGVNRKVVVAAVYELVTQGWLETRPASGTRVASSLPRSAVADVTLSPARREAPAAREPVRVAIDDGLPDARLAPIAELSRAYARALRTLSRAPSGYGDAAGDPVLREVLASFVRQARGLAATTDDVFLTRGSQGALSLYALATLSPGDVVAVESPGYAPAWRAFALAGARVVHVPVDRDGLCTDVLAAKARRMPRLRAVYTTPHHQYPTSVSMTPERRMKLLAIAARHDLTVLEDDYDYEYHFDGQPLLPLHAQGGAARVVYIASLSKLLAPSVRLGYVVAPPGVVRRLRDTRAVLERQGDPALERAIAELFEDGTIPRHARRARRTYAARRDHLITRLRATPALRDALDFDVPGGGLALWLRLRRGTSEALVARARDARLVVAPGSAYVPKGALEALRFGFAAHDEATLTAICEVLARSVG